MAVGLGARVPVFNLSRERLAALGSLYQGRVTTMAPHPEWIEQAVLEADLVIGAVMVPGGRTPVLVSRGTVGRMKKGAVIVDVAVDPGGGGGTTPPPPPPEPGFI